MHFGGYSIQGQFVLTFIWPHLYLAFIYIIVGLFTPSRILSFTAFRLTHSAA